MIGNVKTSLFLFFRGGGAGGGIKAMFYGCSYICMVREIRRRYTDMSYYTVERNFAKYNITLYITQDVDKEGKI